MGDAVCGSYLERMPHIRINLINGYFSSYYYILNSPERIDLINQANKLASVLGDIETDHFGAK